MNNNRWITDDGTKLECAMCKNYVEGIEGNPMRPICVSCRHEYGAHTDDEAKDLDFPKADLFDRR